MDRKKRNIVSFIKGMNKATIGEIYIRFHMMNKGNEFSKEGDIPISAKEIALYVDELCKDAVLFSKKENDETIYYVNLHK